MNQKHKVVDSEYVSFDKDISNKLSEKIVISEPKYRIKLCALMHHHKQKQNLDKELHNELLKLKRNYEKRTFEIVRQTNEIIKSDGTIILKDHNDLIDSFIQGEINPYEPLYYPQINHYWYRCLKNCALLMYIYSNKDGDIAKSISTIDISREDTKSNKSFTLSFTLTEDQKQFTNPFVQVTFYLIDSVNPYRQESNAEYKSKHNKEMSSNGIFLQLFQNINLEDGLNKTGDAHDYCQRLGKSYEIALIFKEELIPYSLEYYLDARNVQMKKEFQEQQMIEKLNEKRIKNKTKYVSVQEDDELADEKYLEENNCKQQ